MRSDSVELSPPLLDQHLRLDYCVQEFAVEQLSPKLAVDTLIVAVLPARTQLDTGHLHAARCARHACVARANSPHVATPSTNGADAARECFDQRTQYLSDTHFLGRDVEMIALELT